MPEESYSGEITEATVIFSALMRANALASCIYSDTSITWSVNARNYVESIQNLSSLCSRHMDQDYYNELRELADIHKKELEEYHLQNPTKGSDTNVGKQKEMQLTLRYAHSKLALIMRQLSEKGVLDEKSIQALPEGVEETED